METKHLGVGFAGGYGDGGDGINWTLAGAEIGGSK